MVYIQFTKDLGQKLMEEGYNHFIMANHKDRTAFQNSDAKLTLQPVKDVTLNKTLPIRQMIDLSEDKLRSIYVLCEN